MIFELFSWWYGRGWLQAWKTAQDSVIKAERQFSTLVLMRTLLSPWKRIISTPGKSIDEKFRAMIDNLISRVIGFFVRFIVLIIAVVTIAVTAVIGLLLALAWPLIPVATAYAFYRGISG